MLVPLFSPTSIRHILSDFLSANGEIILPAVFIGFFLFGAIAILRPTTARTYFVLTVVILLSTSAIFAWTMYPFTHAHRYSPIADEQSSGHDVKVVVDHQEELLDSRTLLPLNTAGGGMIVNAETDKDRLAISKQILSNTKSFYDTKQGAIPRFRHPPPGVRNYWSGSEFGSSPDFNQLRVYEATVTYESNSHEAKNVEQDCVMTIDVKAEIVDEGCEDV